MTTAASTNRIAGSVEYLTVTVTADVELTDQPVALSIDHDVTWLPASWTGDAGTTRKARTNAPVTLAKGSYSVRVKITDSPEVPIIPAGSFAVLAP